MFGAKMRWPEGEPAAIEREVLAAASAERRLRFEALRHLGEGTRRALRLLVAEMAADVHRRGTDPEHGVRSVVVVRFVLPKGGYATTVLGARVSRRRRDAAGRGAAGGSEADETTTRETEPPRARRAPAKGTRER